MHRHAALDPYKGVNPFGVPENSFFGLNNVYYWGQRLGEIGGEGGGGI